MSPRNQTKVETPMYQYHKKETLAVLQWAPKERVGEGDKDEYSEKVQAEERCPGVEIDRLDINRGSRDKGSEGRRCRNGNLGSRREYRDEGGDYSTDEGR